LREQFDCLLSQFREVVEVGRGLGAVGLSICLVNDHEIDVAVIAEFAAAELAEAEDGVATRRTRASIDRESIPHSGRRFRQIERPVQHGIRELAKRRSRFADCVFIEQVADADSQEFLVLEAVQNRVGVVRSFQ